MYHMVDKTKSNELLKLNWLLKLGFSNNSYKIMYDHFYYKTVDDCHGAVKRLSVQELSLLFAYTNICLEALLDKNAFNAHKSAPQFLLLSSILKVQPSTKPLEPVLAMERNFLKENTKKSDPKNSCEEDFPVFNYK
jgi:hypothetical protein